VIGVPLPSAAHFGPGTGELLRFDFQLTRAPSGWRVSEASYRVLDGRLLANGVQLNALHDPRAQISVDVDHGGTGNANPCWSSVAGPRKQAMLRGYNVETTTNPPSDSSGGADTYDLCANDVGGLSFSISTSDHAARSPAELFEHMRFLGPDPADWATRPVS
jgi:hypothetical protein